MDDENTRDDKQAPGQHDRRDRAVDGRGSIAAPPAADPQTDGWRERALPGFIGLIGPLWTRREDADWAYGLQTAAVHANPAGVVHGGLLGSLIDHALSAVAWEAMARRPCVTVQLDTHFVASVAVGSFVEARARVVRQSSSLVFMRGELTVAGETVLAASAVLKALRG